ncbi:MAG: AAA family ATPase [Xanthobacteraceae bacterium]
MTDPSLTNLFVYLVGFGGTGKLTIARAFARAVGAKVVDNHWINNPIFGLIDPDGVTRLPDAVWVQCAKVHEAVLETIATLAKPGTNFVFTHEGVEGNASDLTKFQDIRSTAARRGACLIPVRLVCEEAELVRRIQSPERVGMLKGIDPAAAIAQSRNHAVFDPRSPDTLTLDVTRLSPEESVAAIVAHIKSLAAFPAAAVTAP